MAISENQVPDQVRRQRGCGDTDQAVIRRGNSVPFRRSGFSTSLSYFVYKNSKSLIQSGTLKTELPHNSSQSYGDAKYLRPGRIVSLAELTPASLSRVREDRVREPEESRSGWRMARHALSVVKCDPCYFSDNPRWMAIVRVELFLQAAREGLGGTAANDRTSHSGVSKGVDTAGYPSVYIK